MNYKNDLFMKEIYHHLKKHDVVFVEEHSRNAFDSHMRSLIDRIKLGQVISSDPSEYEAILEEISTEARELALEIAEIAFSDTSYEITMMEQILIATHIQNLYNSK